ncbi:uncharacterized protein VTP21DRAFT_11675 [Calcarisporiella thermophila]|uniref:uncharacterized protein n=1 Tax=Calcarisporiella thermophila TaxID=911321 RepID=UPI0037441A1B
MTAHTSYNRKDLVRSFDSLLYIYFVYVYILDSSLMNLIARCFTQIFISPKTVSRALYAAFFIISLTNLASALRHFGVIDNRGILIDFVSQVHPPSRSYLLLTDAAIFSLQCIFLLIVFLTAGTNRSLGNSTINQNTDSRAGRDVTEDLTQQSMLSSFHRQSRANRDNQERDEDGEEEEEESSNLEYVLDVRLRPILRDMLSNREGEEETALAERRLPV